MQVDHCSVVYTSKPAISRRWTQSVEFMCWRKTGLLDHHAYGCCVCEMTRAAFILTFVNSSRSAMVFTPRRAKTQRHLVLPTDLRKLCKVLLYVLFFANCFQSEVI